MKKPHDFSRSRRGAVLPNTDETRTTIYPESSAPAEPVTPENSTYDAELRASIDRGLADAQAGRVIAVEELMKEFDIAE